MRGRKRDTGHGFNVNARGDCFTAFAMTVKAAWKQWDCLVKMCVIARNGTPAISWKSISLAFLWSFSVTLCETYLPENSGKREALPLFCNLFLSKIVRAENTCN